MIKTNYTEITRKNGAHFNEGTRKDIAFVFSVPGRFEFYNNKPVVGETGVHLEEIIDMLNMLDNHNVKGVSKIKRYDFRITNSYPVPMYGTKSEPNKDDIINDENIKRLLLELEDISGAIVLFGRKAQYIESVLKKEKKLENVVFICERHLSLRSLNSIDKDISGKAITKGNNENTRKRLEVIACNIKSKLKKLNNKSMNTERKETNSNGKTSH